MTSLIRVCDVVQIKLYDCLGGAVRPGREELFGGFQAQQR